MNMNKLYFIVSGGNLFYFFDEDLIEKNENKIKLKKVFYLVHQTSPIMTAQGPALNVLTLTFRFDNVELKYVGMGEVPQDSAIYKAIMQNQTGLSLV